MLSTVATCLHCGTINQAAEPVCAACGGGLAVAVSPSFTAPVYEPVADPDLFPGIQPFSLSDVLSTTLKLFTKHLWLITKIVLVIATKGHDVRKHRRRSASENRNNAARRCRQRPDCAGSALRFDESDANGHERDGAGIF